MLPDPTPDQNTTPPISVITPILQDKAFWAKILAPLIVIIVSGLNHKVGLGLDPTAVDIFVGGVFATAATFVIAHKWAMVSKAKAILGQGTKVGIVIVLLCGGARARADFLHGLDWSIGPTLPLVEYDPGNAHPVALAPGLGVQASITHDAVKRAFFGKSWDLLDLDLLAFGSLVSTAPGQTFGALSLAGAVCTLSSLVCLGGGKHVLSSANAFVGGGWFALFAFSVNVGGGPTTPPVGIEPGARGLPRANTLQLF